MLEIKNLGYNIRVIFVGDKEAYIPYVNYIASLNNSYKDYNDKGWVVPKDYLEEIQDKFDTDFKKEVWDDIGKDMKLEPFPYQKEVIYNALNNPEYMLVLPPGSGKTIIAIGIYLEMKNRKMTKTPCIICTKASLKYQWVQEIEKFCDLKAKEVKSFSAAGKKFDKQFEDADFLVLNYETLKDEKVCKKLKKKKIETIFCDEIHYIGNREVKKSKALHKFNTLKYKYGLTATPITKSPLNLFSIFKLLKKDLFNNYNEFINNYDIELDFYGNYKRCNDEEQLKEAIRSYSFVKDDKEIACQLPKLVVTKMECEMTPQLRKSNSFLFETYDNINNQKRDMANSFRGTKEQLEQDKDYIKLDNASKEIMILAQELADDIYLIEQSSSRMKSQLITKDKTSPKYDLLVNIIESLFEKNENEKICIFTKFVTMQNELARRLEKYFSTNNNICKCALVNGAMDSQERYHQAYDLFQENQDYKFLIATDAMNEGVSLSKCNYLIEYDLSSSYAIQLQRHGRIVRANSLSRTSYVYQLVLNDSWDSKQLNIISRKEGYDDIFIRKLNED